MRWQIPLVVALALFVAVSCDQQPVEPMTDTTAVQATPLFNSGNGVIERVSMGGNDVCGALGLPTGCDANFSLTAHLKADGSVGGQWQDTFAGGQEGIHVAIDCLTVVGNGAVVGGVITHGQTGGVDVSGQRALTALVDNGTSANDAADQLSFSFFPVAGDCTGLVPGNFPLFSLDNGQVTVK